MPRTAQAPDPWSSFVDLLAETLVARMDFPPRASSAAAAFAPPPQPPARTGGGARTRARRRRVKHTSALAAHLVDELLEALAERIDFPPRPSSAAVRVGNAPARRKRAPARPARPASPRRGPRSQAP